MDGRRAGKKDGGAADGHGPARTPKGVWNRPRRVKLCKILNTGELAP